MRVYKKVLSCCMALILCFGLHLPVFAIEQSTVTTGTVELKANVPPNFTENVSVYLEHENGSNYTVHLNLENEYKAIEEVESGFYVIHVGIDPKQADNALTPASYAFRYDTVLIVERNAHNYHLINIIDKNDEKLEEPAQQEAGQTTDGNKETLKQSEQNNDKELTKDQMTEGEEEFERPSLGKKFLRENFFSLTLLVVLCIVTIVFKLRNEI